MAALQELGAGGDEAFNALEGDLGPPDRQAGDGAGRAGNDRDIHESPDGPRAMEEDEEGSWREEVLRAWLMPLLVGSVTERARDARQNLEQWVEFVGRQDGDEGGLGLSVTLEVALAQGLKYAANRRRRHPHARPEARAYLAEQTTEMLRGARFWFSRLTLVHALCLWSLPDGPNGFQSTRGHDANLKTLTGQWVDVWDAEPEHPFVIEASRLAAMALETRQPERFIWTDETSALARVGSRPASPYTRRKHNLWIPPSTGWTVLHPRAQQLVADVLLLLNLSERGPVSDRERRLQRTNRKDLPPCLSGNRSPLDPSRTVGMAATSEPGSNCRDGCTLGLCPYPPKGEVSHRAELSVAFCRRQQALVGKGWVRRRAAPWQGGRPEDLRQFWKQMEQRAQPWGAVK